MEYIIFAIGIVLYLWDDSNTQYRLDKKFKKEIDKERQQNHIRLARKHHPRQGE